MTTNLNLTGIHESMWQELMGVVERVRSMGPFSDEAVERVLASYRAATRTQGLLS